MTDVLVVLDDASFAGGEPTKPAAELLTLARRLGSVDVLSFAGDVDGVATAVGRFGATVVHAVEPAQVGDVLVAAKAAIVAAVVADIGATAVLLPSMLEGREVAGRAAIKLGAGVLTDAVDVELVDGRVRTAQSVFAGGYTVRAEATTPVTIVTVKPNAVAPEPVSGGAAAQVQPVPADAVDAVDTSAEARVTVSEPRHGTGRPDLTEASIVVSGGRGVGSGEQFAQIEELADALGGAVGASRAAVDAGWYPHAFQVGQTGKTVSPQVYIACGISGAIQHRAGMQTSRIVVAVNTDPEAPIFEMADLGIVGDLHDVVPQAAQEARARR